MLPQVYALPGAEPQDAMNDGNGQAGRCQYRSDMGRHVVRTFVGMAIYGVSVGDQALKKSTQIDLDVRIGIFLNDERSRCVVDENMSEPSIETD